jgi:hypothetical protein
VDSFQATRRSPHSGAASLLVILGFDILPAASGEDSYGPHGKFLEWQDPMSRSGEVLSIPLG